MKPLLVVGSSGHAGSILESIELRGEYRVLGLLDSFERVGAKRHGYEVCGGPEDAARLSAAFACRNFFVAVGDNWSRWQIALQLQQSVPGVEFAVVLHPSVLVAHSACIANGAAVLAGSIVGTNAVVEEGCIVNTACTVNHDCRLEPYASLAPGVHLGGATVIGARSSAGIGSALREKITIGRDTVIGAGAVVLDDVPDEVIVFGVPAKVVRQRRPDEAYMR